MTVRTTSSGVGVNLKSWAFAAQVNVAMIATRFAVRALSDERNLMFCPGLIRVRLPVMQTSFSCPS
jgi:hypothetical protein